MALYLDVNRIIQDARTEDFVHFVARILKEQPNLAEYPFKIGFETVLGMYTDMALAQDAAEAEAYGDDDAA